MSATTLQATKSGYDARALQVNQITIVASVVIAFVLGDVIGPWVVALIGASLAIGAARPGSGPIQQLYRRVLVPAGVTPDRRPGDAAQHRFAQGMGAACLLIAAGLLLGGVVTLGWAFAFVVVALALVNLLFGFCAGCFIYLQLGKLRSGHA